MQCGFSLAFFEERLINEPHSVVQTVAEETSHAVTESSYKHNLQEAPKHVYIQ